MKPIGRGWQAGLLAVLLAACASHPAPPPTQALATAVHPSPTASLIPIEPTASPASPATSEAASPAELPRPQYQLHAVLDFRGQHLQVSQQIAYSNRSGEALPEVWLVVEAARPPARFTLTRLASLGGPGLAGAAPTAEDGLLRLALERPLAPGEQIVLELDFHVQLPSGAGMLSAAERQTNLIDWYPYIPPYHSGAGWLAHPPAAVGEHGVYESADFEVFLQVVNAPSTLSVAAPAPAEAEAGGWRYRLQNARRFVWSASGHYLRLQARHGDIPVSIYYYEEYKDAAQASLLAALDALRIYEDLFGPYPYEVATIVICGFPDGMESDALFFLDMHYFRRYSYDRRNYLTMLTAHEIAHHWWFGQVGNDQAEEPWLDESLGIYAELLYYEAVQPNLVDWWWEFRVNRFAPTGAVNSRIYDHADFTAYIGAVYLRGAQFLHALRGEMGDAAFFAFLRDYAEHGQGRVVTQADFFHILGQHTDADINGLLAEFFLD